MSLKDSQTEQDGPQSTPTEYCWILNRHGESMWGGRKKDQGSPHPISRRGVKALSPRELCSRRTRR